MPPRIAKTDPVIISSAVVDGINLFCREVLVARGHLAQEVWQDDSLLKEKYRIAAGVAESWREIECNDDGE
jgi:hypothetical protein